MLTCLDELKDKWRGRLDGFMLVGVDGLILVSALPDNVSRDSADRLAALCATITLLAVKYTHQLYGSTIVYLNLMPCPELDSFGDLVDGFKPFHLLFPVANKAVLYCMYAYRFGFETDFVRDVTNTIACLIPMLEQ